MRIEVMRYEVMRYEVMRYAVAGGMRYEVSMRYEVMW